MDRERLRGLLTRYGLLFVISVVLVGGFWFHGEFYQIGLVPLLIIGGFATFLMLLTIRALQTGVVWRGRARGEIRLPREASERVLAGTQTMAVFPVTAALPPPGTIARAVVATTGADLVRLRVQDVRRRLAADVREEEAMRAGYDGLDAFRAGWAKGRRWDPREIVVLVEFRKEART